VTSDRDPIRAAPRNRSWSSWHRPLRRLTDVAEVFTTWLERSATRVVFPEVRAARTVL
jgi:hypothetical protein